MGSDITEEAIEKIVRAQWQKVDDLIDKYKKKCEEAEVSSPDSWKLHVAFNLLLDLILIFLCPMVLMGNKVKQTQSKFKLQHLSVAFLTFPKS